MGVFQPGAVRERVELANEPEFDLGGLRIKPAERIVCANGEQRELQPRIMQVLITLAKARPQVVSRELLAELCWDGRIVTDDALNRCILVLRHLAQDFSPQPFEIQTVPRVGHRLIENIRTHQGASRHPKLRHFFAIAALLLVAIAGSLGWHQLNEGDEPTSIAVLPFRNLSAGEPYFAQGIGEEVLAQLARDPQFRVAGSSSSALAARSGDVREAARRLNVDYIVEGSVRRDGDRVRVNAYLVEPKDGVRLWSDSFDGRLDDIFAIQRRIGGAIAGALQHTLVRAQPLAGPLTTDGKAYELYLTSRALIRTRKRQAGPLAADLLRDAIQIDPSYAPAWASLGEATLLAGALQDHESFVSAVEQAQAYASRALALAPNLPEAHRAAAAFHGFGTRDAVSHLRRAAELEPNNPESLIGLGHAFGAVGEFEEELAAYRRAWIVDPLWFRAVSTLAVTTAEMGDRADAELIVRQGLQGDPIEQHLLMAKIAWIFGDISEAIRHWSIIERSKSPRWSESARRNREAGMFALGLGAKPVRNIPRPLDQRHFERITLERAPDPLEWKSRNRNPIAAAVYRDENHVAAKLMLNVGRWRDLVAAYDGPGGAIGLRRGQPLRRDQLGEAAIVALALQSAGRLDEANQLVTQANRFVRLIERRGRVPFWFHADAAALSAVAGRKDEAIRKLDRAFRAGWRHWGATDLRDLAHEPAFRPLRGQARFERLRSQLSLLYAREREQADLVRTSVD